MEEKESILKEVLRLLGEKYPIGLYEYLFKNQREGYKELLRLEDRIDMAYLIGTVEELKAVLREYWRFHIKVIKEFEKADKFNLSAARVEMTEERIRA
jgi:hypothetical protein